MFRRLGREFPGLELQMVVSMTRATILATVLIAAVAGCGPSAAEIKEKNDAIERHTALLQKRSTLKELESEMSRSVSESAERMAGAIGMPEEMFNKATEHHDKMMKTLKDIRASLKETEDEISSLEFKQRVK